MANTSDPPFYKAVGEAAGFSMVATDPDGVEVEVVQNWEGDL